MLGRLAASEPKAKAGLRLTLRTGAELPFNSLGLDTLPLYLNGNDELPFRLYEQLLGNACAVFARAPGSDWVERLPQDALRSRGFDDCDAALPVVPQAFQGYRLLQEYFALPNRFLFVEFAQLSRAVQRCAGQELELIVLFERFEQSLEGSVAPASSCRSAPRRSTCFPCAWTASTCPTGSIEYHVIADRTRPMDFEVHSLTALAASAPAPEHARSCRSTGADRTLQP